MEDHNKPIARLVEELKERAKELNCLYEVQETLSTPGITTAEALTRINEVIPPGWQYPEICVSRISVGEKTFQPEDFLETSWVQRADIVVQDQVVGRICVYYTEAKPGADEGPFLLEERRLINTISDQIGNFLLNQQLQDVFEKQTKPDPAPGAGWPVVLTLLEKNRP